MYVIKNAINVINNPMLFKIYFKIHFANHKFMDYNVQCAVKTILF